jgi:MoaA/NifB/PqqE/SkfB family radical SAM enzyme
MKVVKAEILLSKRCNFRCGYCNMPQRPAPKELSVGQWAEIFTVLTEELGCLFYAVYGAEPMLHRDIFDIIAWLQDWGKATYSLLTNGRALLDNDGPARLLDAGLESLTLSVDSVKDLRIGKSISKRHRASGVVLAWALTHRDVIKDLQCTSTLHRQNIGKEVYELIEFLSERDVWWSADLIHDNKLGRGEGLGYDPQYSKVSDPHSGYAFGLEDAPRLREFLIKILEMKQAGYKIYQSEEWWEFLIAAVVPRAIKREWRCSAYPAWLTVDSDGQVLVCDDFQAKSPFYALDLLDRFDGFVQFREGQLAGNGCRGCAWSTHWMAYEQLASEFGVSQVTHGRK